MIIATQQLHGNHWNVPNLHLLLLWLVGDVALVLKLKIRSIDNIILNIYTNDEAYGAHPLHLDSKLLNHTSIISYYGSGWTSPLTIP